MTSTCSHYKTPARPDKLCMSRKCYVLSPLTFWMCKAVHSCGTQFRWVPIDFQHMLPDPSSFATARSHFTALHYSRRQELQTHRSKAFIDLHLSVSDHMIEPKWLKLQLPNLPRGESIISPRCPLNIRSKSQRSRSQGHKVEKHISGLKAIEWPAWVLSLHCIEWPASSFVASFNAIFITW